VYPREPTVSEQESLRSMRSHLGPYSARSVSGSAPASHTNSEHSRGLTASSLKSVAHSSSISSMDRRLVRRSTGEASPPLSATGRHFSVLLSRGVRGPSPSPEVAVPHPTTTTTVTSAGTRSSVTTHTSVTDPITGEVSRLPHAAWTGGRDLVEEEEEGGLPLPPRSWNGSWSSPSHLHILQNRVTGRDSRTSHA
jgi:ribosomal protein L31